MPLIPPYGLRVPEKSDQPDVAGDMLNLGEDVRDELVRIDNDIAEIHTELGRGWVPIGFGEENSNFTIDLTAGGKFPAGTFALIRVHMRGSLTVDGVRIQVRVNADNTAGLHRHARWVWNSNDSSLADSSSFDGTAWPVAEWSTANVGLAEFTIFRTDATSQLDYVTQGYRGGGTGVRRLFLAGGDLSTSRLLNSLQVFPVSGAVATCRWWAEGYRT